eukprot:gene5881-7321_t
MSSMELNIAIEKSNLNPYNKTKCLEILSKNNSKTPFINNAGKEGTKELEEYLNKLINVSGTLAQDNVLRRSFSISGIIFPSDTYKDFYVDPQPLSDHTGLTDAVKDRKWIMLYGPRSSGKSTRIVRLMDHLSETYLSFRVSFQSCFYFQSEESFWKSLSDELNDGREVKLFDGKMVVLIIDEFDEIFYHSPPNVAEEILSIFRSLRDNLSHTLQSMIVIGPFSLEANIKTGSPFNVKESIANPDFTLDMTKSLFQQFATERNVYIDPEVIEDIYDRTCVHAGLINLCGRIIDSKLINPDRKVVTYEHWINCGSILLQQLDGYSTTQRLLAVVSKKNDNEPHLGYQSFSIPPYNNIIKILKFLLRSNNSVPFGEDEKSTIKYIVSEGLAKIYDATSKIGCSETYIIRSPLIQQFLLENITIIHPRNSPQSLFPICDDGTINIPTLIIESVREFNRNDIKDSTHISPKTYKTLLVPCEATYHEELFSIISRWKRGFPVILNTNVKVKEIGNHSKRYDISIRYHSWLCYLELVAHESLGSLTEEGTIIEHVFRTSKKYGPLLNVNQAWVINFTTDIQTTNYVSTYSNVKIIHVLHNLDCSEFVVKVQQNNNSFQSTNIVL